MAVPAPEPAVTTPPASTLATVASLLLHVPPDVVLLSVLVVVIHALNVPVIGAGDAFTVTVTVAKHPAGNV